MRASAPWLARNAKMPSSVGCAFRAKARAPLNSFSRAAGVGDAIARVRVAREDAGGDEPLEVEAQRGACDADARLQVLVQEAGRLQQGEEDEARILVAKRRENDLLPPRDAAREEVAPEAR